jgi:hypothetical protein
MSACTLRGRPLASGLTESAAVDQSQQPYAVQSATAAQNWVPTRSIKMFCVKELPAVAELR